MVLWERRVVGETKECSCVVQVCKSETLSVFKSMPSFLCTFDSWNIKGGIIFELDRQSFYGMTPVNSVTGDDSGVKGIMSI